VLYDCLSGKAAEAHVTHALTGAAHAQLRDTVQRLSVELRLCTMVVQEVSTKMGAFGEGPGGSGATAVPAARDASGAGADGAGDDGRGSAKRGGEDGGVEGEDERTQEERTQEEGHERVSDSAKVVEEEGQGARESKRASARERDREREGGREGGREGDREAPAGLAGAHGVSLGKLPMDAYMQPWTSITWTLQTLGRQLMHSMLDHDVAHFVARNRDRVSMVARYRASALLKVQTAATSLWPRAQCKVFGSVATGLSVPSSDVDIIVCLPKVLSRESEPSLARAGVMEGKHVIKGTLQANLAQFLQNADWVQSDSLKTIENSTVPVIQLTTRPLAPVATVKAIPEDMLGERVERDSVGERNVVPPASRGRGLFGEGLGAGGAAGRPAAMEAEADACVRLDVTFEGPNHQGLSAVSLVTVLLQDFPALEPLFLVVRCNQQLACRCNQLLACHPRKLPRAAHSALAVQCASCGPARRCTLQKCPRAQPCCERLGRMSHTRGCAFGGVRHETRMRHALNSVRFLSMRERCA